jgi:LPS-assembly lipoprotein
MRLMSWLKYTLSVLVLAGVTACGFQPMYGDYSAGKVTRQNLQQVKIAGVNSNENTSANSVRIGERLSQQFSNKLIDRMYKDGYPKNPTFDVVVTLTSAEREIGIQKDATATRAELSMNADILLRDYKTQQELYRTKARTRVAYNILDGQYGTLIAKENAYDRAQDQLASDVVSRIALYLNRDNQ